MTDEQDLMQDFIEVDRPVAGDWRSLLEQAGVTRVHLRNGTTYVGIAKRRGTSLTPWIVLEVKNSRGGDPLLIDQVYIDPEFIVSVTIESVGHVGRIRTRDE